MSEIKCCACSAVQKSTAPSIKIKIGSKDYYLCKDCSTYFEVIRDKHYRKDVSAQIDKFRNRIDFNSVWDSNLRQYLQVYLESNGKSEDEVKTQLSAIIQNQEAQDEVQFAEYQKREQELARVKENILVTSGNSFEGYRIIEYKGFQSVDVVFKNSLKDSFVTGIEDLGRMLSFRAQLMTGVMTLLENGKEHGFDLFYEKVVRTGANAIVGMDMESTIGETYVKVQLNGTAVVVEKI